MMDFTAISTYTAIITALVAIIAIWIEGRRSRFLQGLDILVRYSDKFNNEKYISRRKIVSKYLFKRYLGEETKYEDLQKVNLYMWEILDHFQEVGMMLKKKILDIDFVDSEYYFWVYFYFTFFKQYLTDYRKTYNDPNYYYEAEWLYNQLLIHEMKTLHSKKLKSPTREEILAFFNEEINLD